MNIDRLVSLDDLPAWREGIRRSGRVLVVTNGCFDVLHAGHVGYLTAARAQGDLLIVGLNSDESVRALKGPTRPIHPDTDRARVLAALRSVDAVCIFPETRATHFLQVAQPDVYVKGGDFRVEDLPEEERHAVLGHGGRILTLGHLPGRSTTSILARLRTEPPASGQTVQ